MALQGDQQRNLKTILAVGMAKHASPKELLAAVETGLVEANLHNPSGGDGSSVGWRQETASSYPGVNRMDVKAAAGRFFDETAKVRGQYSNPGALAQAVQRSAFPGRYNQQAGTASSLLKHFDMGRGKNPEPRPAGGNAQSTPTTATTVTTPPSAAAVGVSGILQQRAGSSSLLNRLGLLAAQSTTTTKLGSPSAAPGAPSTARSVRAPSQWAFPVAGKYTENRTDRGVDLETRPGSPIVSVGSGTVVNTNGAFPGGSIVVKLDHPIGGYSYTFVGHLNGQKNVKVGQRVKAGDVLARSSASPTGAANMPGHVEIGLVNNSSGQIESAHDNTHNTQSGNTFHRFLSIHFPGKVAKNPIIG